MSTCVEFFSPLSNTWFITDMATKIECAINPLATSPGSSKTFSFRCVNELDFSGDRELRKGIGSAGVDKFLDGLMDWTAEKKDIESIRKTMLLHEDIFKQQVHELHRLYNVQKLLMSELKKEIDRNQHRRGSESNYVISWPMHRTNQPSGSPLFHLQSSSDEPSPNERSSSSCFEALRMPGGFDLENNVKERSNVDDELPGPSGRNPRENDDLNISGSDDETDVDLTLSIGGKKSGKKSRSCQDRRHEAEVGFSKMNHKELISTSSFKSDRGDACSGPTTSMGGPAAPSDQERKRPHWLFQV